MHRPPTSKRRWPALAMACPWLAWYVTTLLTPQYARYFGGDLKLISMEGYVIASMDGLTILSYGTDVYLHLNRLSSSSEPLP